MSDARRPTEEPAPEENVFEEDALRDDTESEGPTSSVRGAALAELAALEQRGRVGANWFFWVAALSLVNTAIAHSGEDRHFVIGLAVTQFVDAIGNGVAQQQPEAATVVRVIAVALSVFVSAVVALFGWLSRKRILPVFILGMALYVLDGLVFALFGDWMSAGFHAFALWGMWSGLTAYRELKQRMAQLSETSDIGPAEELTPA